MPTAIAVAATLLAACRANQRVEPAEVAPELKLERVRFRVWRGEALRAEGEAREVSIRRDTGLATALDIRAELPARDQPVVVTAPRAQGDLTAQVFSARGGVVVTHGGERAVTERARYEPGRSGNGWITGDAPVTVDRGSTRLEGVGFTFDPQAGELALGGPVTTRSEGEKR
jgi:lipopolysaccharide export system protein LptC